ncbi:hypothetical protein [Peribacillus cavernae]|uniref:hypothetical protein n=1 Tax=Peribacillus cavernae TaxID=1674310 RepID=UPI00163C6D0D|nr:hypothetical protein [Peribacillus cavernae]MDQ0219875.1 hypothetical protein [Peribacillus cavernae]
MEKKNPEQETESTVAPGFDYKDELNESATEEEIEKDEYTNVTTLSLDEVEPS